MKKGCIFLTLLFLFAQETISAQVLFSDDFDSHTNGPLTPPGTFPRHPGQGGWIDTSFLGTTHITITPETGRGKVVMFEGVNPTAVAAGISDVWQHHSVVSSLWSMRTPGNDVFKFEYEFYSEGDAGATFGIPSDVWFPYPGGGWFTPYLIFIGASPYGIEGIYLESLGAFKEVGLMDFNTAGTTFPSNTWVKVELFIDYPNQYVYFYLPAFNIKEAFPISHNVTANSSHSSFAFQIGLNDPWSVVKLDNVKYSALPALPPYMLSAAEVAASKFGVFPNPATDVVTITNSENIGIEQIEVYDVSGKTIKSQIFNNESEVQLNMSDFAAGMYLLHIKTKEGMAVKRVVKK